MANALYEKYGKLALDADLDLLVDNIKCVLVDTATYTVDLVNHDFLDDIPAGERVATSGNMTTKTTTAGVFDADNITFSSVSGDVSEALVIYKDTGVAATSPLIAYIDTAAAGLPVTPNGGDITITWNASGIFSIVG